MWLRVLLLLVGFVQLVNCGGTGTVRIISYSNPNHKDEDDLCCENLSHSGCKANDCDPFFSLCIDRVTSPGSCIFSHRKTSVYNNQGNINFGSTFAGGSNPIPITFTSWGGGVQVRIVVKDHDDSFFDSKDDPIGTVRFGVNGLPSPWPSPKMVTRTFIGGQARMRIEYGFVCDQNFYGDCSVYCKPDAQHYRCGTNGNKICLTGWKGYGCLTNVTTCTTNPCQNQATCLSDITDVPTCHCTTWFTGLLCETRITTTLPTTTPTTLPSTTTTTTTLPSTTATTTTLPSTTTTTTTLPSTTTTTSTKMATSSFQEEPSTTTSITTEITRTSTSMTTTSSHKEFSTTRSIATKTTSHPTWMAITSSKQESLTTTAITAKSTSAAESSTRKSPTTQLLSTHSTFPSITNTDTVLTNPPTSPLILSFLFPTTAESSATPTRSSTMSVSSKTSVTTEPHVKNTTDTAEITTHQVTDHAPSHDPTPVCDVNVTITDLFNGTLSIFITGKDWVRHEESSLRQTIERMNKEENNSSHSIVKIDISQTDHRRWNATVIVFDCVLKKNRTITRITEELCQKEITGTSALHSPVRGGGSRSVGGLAGGVIAAIACAALFVGLVVVIRRKWLQRRINTENCDANKSSSATKLTTKHETQGEVTQETTTDINCSDANPDITDNVQDSTSFQRDPELPPLV